MTTLMPAMEALRILEIAEGVAGPNCGLLFADLGADVIKIEPPEGDRSREWGPPVEGDDAAIFCHLNRGKRSIVLDLTKEDARKSLDGLLAAADAVIVHPDPAMRGEIGIDWRRLCQRHPHLVVCEIDDFGGEGRFAGLPGSELTIQAMSGFTRYVGDPGGEPCRVGYEVAGMAVAMHSFQGIIAALIHRDEFGKGQHLAVSGLGSLLSMKTILLAAQSGGTDDWDGFHLNGPRWPADTGWDTKDGQITFDFRHGQRDGWVKFCEAVGLGYLPDHPDYADWRSTIYIGDRRFEYGEPYREVFARMTCEEASALINGFGGISVKFHNYGEMLDHPQVRILEPLLEVDDASAATRRQVGQPFRFHDEPRRTAFRRAPRLDEHRDEVLSQLKRAGASHAAAE